MSAKRSKGCATGVGDCKSHFRGIKQYYLLAIVPQGFSITEQARAMTVPPRTSREAGFPCAGAFLKVLTAIKIKHME